MGAKLNIIPQTTKQNRPQNTNFADFGTNFADFETASTEKLTAIHKKKSAISSLVLHERPFVHAFSPLDEGLRKLRLLRLKNPTLQALNSKFKEDTFSTISSLPQTVFIFQKTPFSCNLATLQSCTACYFCARLIN